jgi:dihydrodipicolinate synthase/N-acetylneuraminate lyase
VDGATFGRPIEFTLREGADALLPTALTGEGPLLSSDEMVAVWEATVVADDARRRCPSSSSTTLR